MALLILGVALWAYSHLMKRVTPGFRAGLGDATGKMVATGLTVLSIVLMVIGYKSADVVQLWNPPAFMRHINNLLMLIAIILVGLGYSRGVLRTKLRHPMLAGVKVWALAHLLVNGDLASVVLFGGILAWAVVDMILINRMEPAWQPPKPGPVYFDVLHVVISVVVMGVIGMIHTYLGYPPFG